MQFFATFALLIVAVSALPAANPIEEGSIFKRTCGTLSGTALTVCQEACLAACNAASVGLASKLCSTACTTKPL